MCSELPQRRRIEANPWLEPRIRCLRYEDGASAGRGVLLGLRMAADVANGVEAAGRGYNGRLEKLIREAFANGKLAP